ncbi:MAG: HAD hydrolase-like protein [Pseudomonadota bacterium]
MSDPYLDPPLDPQDFDWIIFDVDGVLLELTPPETALFLQAFAPLGIHTVSDDWNSYKKRNDLEIAKEVIETHFGRPAREDEVAAVIAHYLRTIEVGLTSGTLRPKVLLGVPTTLEALSSQREREGRPRLGLASANLEQAARLRLRAVGLEAPFEVGGFAEHGTNKTETLTALIMQNDMPPNRVLFIGDQSSDTAAALENGVTFLGIASEPEHQAKLRLAGAQLIAPDLPTAGLLGR